MLGSCQVRVSSQKLQVIFPTKLKREKVLHVLQMSSLLSFFHGQMLTHIIKNINR
jgi:hypothetical protein